MGSMNADEALGQLLYWSIPGETELDGDKGRSEEYAAIVRGELATLRSIITAFADRLPVYETDMADLYCIYCDDYREYDAVQEKELERLACHEPTCPWRLAVEYVERGKLKE